MKGFKKRGWSVIVLVVALVGFLSHAKPDSDRKEGYETENHNPSEQTDQMSSIFVDLGPKKVNLPHKYISCIYKDTYIDREKIENTELISKIISDINNAEIAAFSLDLEEIISVEPLQNISQYPLTLETACKSDFLRVGLLAQNQDDYLVQLSFMVPSENMEYTDNPNIPPYDGKDCYMICFLKSKDLYDDIKKVWGERITLRALQSPKRITVFYNPAHHLYTEDTSTVKMEFTSEDAVEFAQTLQEEAIPVYDEHPFGITFYIETDEKDSIYVYYAEDGCTMFELDGVSYRLEDTDSSAGLAKKYISKLEEIISDKVN